MEIPFFFKLDRSYGPLWDKELFSEENRRGREALSNAMMTYVAQFIRTGDPNKPGSEFTKVKWLPWSNEVGGPKCIIFDAAGYVADIRMTTEEMTEEAVQAKTDALPEPLRTKVKTAIERLQPGAAPLSGRSD